MGFEYIPNVFKPGKRLSIESMNELTDDEE
jgi:hypothetical protein